MRRSYCRHTLSYVATCPKCGVSTRIEPGSMVVEEVLVAKPPLSFSLSGHSIKWVASKVPQLRCTHCSFKVLGSLQDGEFVAKASDVEDAMRDDA